jgi:cytochrome c-type biogenesis protein CcmF
MPAALTGMVSRNRRRYGGYVVHAGVAVLLIGIAASSSFQTNRDVTLKPGDSAVIDGRTVTYLKPTVHTDANSLDFGAVLKVQQGGSTFFLHPVRRYFKPTGVATSTIASYFDGEATSEVGLKAGAADDFWTTVAPNISGVQAQVRKADGGFRACVSGAPGSPPQCRAVAGLMRAAAANPSLRPTALAQIDRLQAATAARIAQTYVAEGTPATFRVIVDPLVTWIWIGGLIALSGAIIALWPARRSRRDLAGAGSPELEALKEAKYREIRDAELEHAAGKLSDADFPLLDAELRKEAVEILDRGNGHGNGNDPVATRPAERG